MHDLTVEQLLAIHAGIMTRDGGDARVLSEGNLHQMVFQANLLTEPLARAASAMYFLCAYPAFREGNKRTAQAVAGVILAEEGLALPTDDPRGIALLQGVMDFTVETEDIEHYIRTVAEPVQGSGST
ncbi:Fic family protein [Methanoregula sp.]|uniref:Fic family protein n=1 Tax=Methanoregula sp. TaxID=2052170 RepID=UPI003566C613